MSTLDKKTPPPAAMPAHVLIVDDLEVNRDLLARRVARLGHSHDFADSGRTALARPACPSGSERL